MTDISPAHIHSIRHFNRFYTRQAGVLSTYSAGNLSLTDARVLYELAHRPGTVASDLAAVTGLDHGYLSRILKRFESSGWLNRETSPKDGRQVLLNLTPAGRQAFVPLEEEANANAAAVLRTMGDSDRKRLVDAMQEIERLLDPKPLPRSTTATAPTAVTAAAPVAPVTIVLRDVRPGDLGWVVQAHAEAYTREYGWDNTFEALVAEIVAQFVRTFDSSGERGWIAEIDGERVGSIFLVRGSDPTTAKIRLLLVTPAARGSGLGNRLVTECIEFARSKGYEKIELWTHSCLTAARAMYAKRGFALVESDEYEGFGQKLVWENWEMTL
ncbi:hypothetical protein EHS25_000686 [Saitozyma podzolica]|uniref:N-acetyltransferase domain-containing protein n=1 Tax=Saitozyma podzolica TaxID=1890683 RepID=A0A427YWY9_9TREE|nr:hypothetical protein EHS25_000686 [Saitozyma podzolica]